MSSQDKCFPFLPGDIVTIGPGINWDNTIMSPINVGGEVDCYTFYNYELGRECGILYIREGRWRYNFMHKSDGTYVFQDSYMCDDPGPFKPHLR